MEHAVRYFRVTGAPAELHSSYESQSHNSDMVEVNPDSAYNKERLFQHSSQQTRITIFKHKHAHVQLHFPLQAFTISTRSREKLVKLLTERRIPLKQGINDSHGTLEIMNMLTIRPPYTDQQCDCNNGGY